MRAKGPLCDSHAMSNWDAFLRGTDWYDALKSEFGKPYWASLRGFVDEQRRAHPDRIYPPQAEVDAALQLTPLAATRVVILGQDPYFGFGQAHGLSFSVRKGVPPPPSLVNIFRKLQEDLDLEPPEHGHLASWSRNGVLLLNTTLTVRDGEAGSHRGQGWARFTSAVIREIKKKPDPVTFILWGSDARRKAASIGKPHRVIQSTHPSPKSAYRQPHSFFDSHPFLESGLDPSAWDCTN